MLDALDQERRLFRHCRGGAVCARRDLRDFERDLMHRVLRHRNGDVAVFLNFPAHTDFIGIGGCSGVVHFASLCRQRSFNRINYRGFLRRILAVNIHRKGERVMPVDGSHARRNGAIARAGGDRHRVGELFPDGVERDRRVVQVLAARLIGHGACGARRPALEGVAVAGRVRHRQRQRNAVCLGLRGGNAIDRRISVRVRVVVHGVGHRGQLAVDDNIALDHVGRIRLCLFLRVRQRGVQIREELPFLRKLCVLIPAPEFISGDLRLGGRINLVPVFHRHNRVQAAIRFQGECDHARDLALRANGDVVHLVDRVRFCGLLRLRAIAVDLEHLRAVDAQRSRRVGIRLQLDLERVAIFKCIGGCALCLC